MISLFSPLEQFSIYQTFTFFIKIKLFGLVVIIDRSLTNFLIENYFNLYTFFLLISSYLFFSNRKFIYNSGFIIFLYKFMFSILEQQVKNKYYVDTYFILISTAFLLIFLNNFIGTIPYSFVTTAQLGQNFFFIFIFNYIFYYNRVLFFKFKIFKYIFTKCT